MASTETPLKTTRVMLVDDHPVVLTELGSLLDAAADLEVVAKADSLMSAVSQLDAAVPDVVLMDLDLPGDNGLVVTAELLRRDPLLKVVMLSAWCTRALLDDAARAGAVGYLLKGELTPDPCDAVRAAARGERPFSPLARRLGA